MLLALEDGSPASIHNGRDRSPMDIELVAQAFTAALITALATGLGALPVVLLRIKNRERPGGCLGICRRDDALSLHLQPDCASDGDGFPFARLGGGCSRY